MLYAIDFYIKPCIRYRKINAFVPIVILNMDTYPVLL